MYALVCTWQSRGVGLSCESVCLGCRSLCDIIRESSENTVMGTAGPVKAGAQVGPVGKFLAVKHLLQVGV